MTKSTASIVGKIRGFPLVFPGLQRFRGFREHREYQEYREYREYRESRGPLELPADPLGLEENSPVFRLLYRRWPKEATL